MAEKKDNNQEIDLIELFTNIFDWVGKQIKWVFNIGLAVFYFFLRNSLWFIGFVVAGAILGYGVDKASETYYSSNMIVHTRAISDFEAIKNINHWNYKIALDTFLTSGIQKVSATYLLDKNKDGKWDIIEESGTVNTTDTTITNYRQNGIISINIEATDTTKITPMKEEVWKFLHNIPRVKIRNDIRITQQKELIPRYEKEIRDLDSLKMQLYFDAQKSTSTSVVDGVLVKEKNTNLYHNQTIALFKQKQSIERGLVLYQNPFDLIFDFPTPKHNATEVKAYSYKYIKLFLFLGFFLVLFIDQRKFLIKLIMDSRKK